VTCIAARPGLIVSDSRESGIIKRTVEKLFQPHGTFAVGTAGDCGALNAIQHVVPWPKRPSVKTLAKWVHRHHRPDVVDFDEVALLVCTRNKLFVVEGQYVFEADVYAVGSGCAFAFGYLHAHPKDVEGAVGSACKYDPFCAGPLRKIEV